MAVEEAAVRAALAEDKRREQPQEEGVAAVAGGGRPRRARRPWSKEKDEGAASCSPTTRDITTGRMKRPTRTTTEENPCPPAVDVRGVKGSKRQRSMMPSVSPTKRKILLHSLMRMPRGLGFILVSILDSSRLSAAKLTRAFLFPPANYPRRDYQYSITRKAMFHNTLVSLPTGLGKTFIAAVGRQHAPFARLWC